MDNKSQRSITYVVKDCAGRQTQPFQGPQYYTSDRPQKPASAKADLFTFGIVAQRLITIYIQGLVVKTVLCRPNGQLR